MTETGKERYAGGEGAPKFRTSILNEILTCMLKEEGPTFFEYLSNGRCFKRVCEGAVTHH